ncbi:methionine--tRNA ligase [Buchnera aphidicola (Kurisakia onigurumii)]|uniref:methionine--tRNA ligase n=1 Tax=Buchnera aphidicola TaxID=9 RepID=UPI0031B6834F
MQIKKKILVTCAFPYSNGSIHLGHLLEHIQADIWVRYQKMQGNTVFFICSDDSHGTAITLKSKKEKITPVQLVKKIILEHKKDFKNFNILHDNYSSTHSIENLSFVRKIYFILQKKKLIKKKYIYQFYDTKKNIFLSDRLVQGTCPDCNFKNQYGDHCDNCGSTYSAIQLINPKSVLSNSIPKIKKSEHIFFDLPKLELVLKKWIYSGSLQNTVLNKTKEWFNKGLRPWDISRDKPYFGFKIPGLIDKYFYVWLDASIGYISNFKNFCTKNKIKCFNDFWNENTQCELHQFIGKDIIYFHTLFWPSILHSINFRKPSKIIVHGHVTFNGSKLSKSKGLLILAKDWINYLDSDSIRYYYASNLSSKVEDIEINLYSFREKINSDIVNKIVNIASRSSSFIHKYFDGILSSKIEEFNLYKYFVSSSIEIECFLEKKEFKMAIQKILKMADYANQYINDTKPWSIDKNKSKSLYKLQQVCSLAINFFRCIMTWLKPIMPNLSIKVEKFLNIVLNFNTLQNPLLNHKISKFTILYKRISLKEIDVFLHDIKKSYF